MRTLPLVLALALAVPLTGNAKAQQSTLYQSPPLPTANYQAPLPDQPVELYQPSIPYQQPTYQAVPVQPIDACIGVRRKLQQAYKMTARWKRRCDRLYTGTIAPEAGGSRTPPEPLSGEQFSASIFDNIRGPGTPPAPQCDENGLNCTMVLRQQVAAHYPPDPPANDEATTWLEALLEDQRWLIVSRITPASVSEFERIESETCWSGLLRCKVSFRQRVIQEILNQLATRS